MYVKKFMELIEILLFPLNYPRNAILFIASLILRFQNESIMLWHRQDVVIFFIDIVTFSVSKEFLDESNIVIQISFLACNEDLSMTFCSESHVSANANLKTDPVSK